MNVSNIYPGQNQPMNGPHSQEPYYANNSFVNSLSTINNFFGANQQKPEQQNAQPYDEDNEPPLLEGKISQTVCSLHVFFKILMLFQNFFSKRDSLLP